MEKLKELASLFFKLGVTAFGGPAAHIAMMEDEVIEKRKWMTREHFLDLVGATNLIPGPNSTEMVMHVGLQRAGFAGMLVAGICFIFPAALMTGILAWFYVQYGSLPAIEPFLAGIKPAVLAIILGAIIKLGKKALKENWYAVIGLGVIVAALFGINEVFAILAGGIIGMLAIQMSRRMGFNSFLLFPLGALPLLQTQVTEGISAIKLFLVFLKVGAILFGSGYVLFAYLEGELIQGLGWLTEQQLLDAIAAGQFTPGPVLTTSTFIGYQIYGLPGAIAATVGIFLPSFLFVYLLNPLIPKLRESKWASAFLDAVNISAVGVMIAVLIDLGQSTLIDWRAWLIAAISVAITFGTKKVSSMWIIAGSALLGYLLHLI